MKLVEDTFPLPLYMINKNYQIQSYSAEAEKLSGVPVSLLDILDEGSVQKVKNWVIPSIPKTSLEVNVLTGEEQEWTQLVDLYVYWDNDLQAKIILHEKNDQLQKVTEKLNALKSRLSDSNFQLLEEKEKLEEALEQNNYLSAPIIELTEEVGLIPLFGDITKEKMHAVESRILFNTQQENFERLFFDFTAVGELKQEGVEALSKIIYSLFYMGTNVSVISIQPQHARRLKELKLPSDLTFLNTLHQAINKYCAN